MITKPHANLATLKAWALENRRIAETVLLAQAFAECERQRVDAYIRPIFDRYGFVYGSLLKEMEGKPIEKPGSLYLATDEAKVAAYFAECDTAHRAHGFTGPQGHCPALHAESLHTQAENVLIEAATELFGIESTDLYGDKRTQYLNILIGACLHDSDTSSASILARVRRTP